MLEYAEYIMLRLLKNYAQGSGPLGLFPYGR